MNIVSLVLFAHVVGMIGFFVAIGFEGVAFSRDGRHAPAELPVLYRGSLGLTVASGAFLTRGLLQGSSATVWDLGWLVASVLLLAVVAVAGFLPASTRAQLFVARISASLAVVLLMIAKPPLPVSLGIAIVAACGGVASGLLTRRRTVASTAIE